MAKFLSNLSGTQTLILIFGIIILAVAIQVIFPEAYSTIIGSIMDGISAGMQLFQGGSP